MLKYMSKIKNIIWIKLILMFIGLMFLILIYAHYEYTNLKVNEIIIESNEIPENFNGKKILFLADFQLDTLTRYNKKQMDRIVKLVNSTEKDIILMGGDYVNWTGKIDRFYKDMEKLKNPKYGTYVILGNHDYVDTEKTIKNLKKLGYDVLRNKNSEVKINNEKIFIAGVEDLWKGFPDATKALEGIKKDDFAILLSHNPEYFEEINLEDKKRADLILAGHVHGGQVTFFGKIIHGPVKNLKKYGYGMKEYDGNKLYITSGVGGAAFEMYIRFFARPEIVIFKLKKI